MIRFVQGNGEGGLAVGMIFVAADLRIQSWERRNSTDSMLRLASGVELSSAPAMLRFQADAVTWLRPSAGIERYRLTEWLTFLLTEIEVSERPLADSRLAAEPRFRLEAAQAMKWQFVADHLGKRRFLVGEALSVADVYLAACFAVREHRGSLAPQLGHYRARVDEVLDRHTGRFAAALAAATLQRTK